MSIASHAETFGSAHALPAGAATSRLDRELASLAGLGSAIRDEIAQSLAPMKAELDIAWKLVSMLEVRVRDLEERPAATAVTVCDPDLPHHATGRALETPPESAPERAETVVANLPIVEDEIASGAPNQPESAAAHDAPGGLGAATGTARLGSQAHDPVPLSAATGAVAEQQMPAEAPTRRRKPRKVADPKSATVAPAPAVTITLVLSPGVSASAAPASLVLAQFPQISVAIVSVSLAVGATTPAAPVVDTPDPVSESSLPAPAVADFAEQAPAANERSEHTGRRGRASQTRCRASTPRGSSIRCSRKVRGR